MMYTNMLTLIVYQRLINMVQELLRELGFLSKYLNNFKDKLKNCWTLILEDVRHEKIQYIFKYVSIYIPKRVINVIHKLTKTAQLKLVVILFKLMNLGAWIKLILLFSFVQQSKPR